MSLKRIDLAAARRWGRSYKGQGDLDQAIECLVKGVLAPEGFQCERHSLPEGVVVIEATQKSPWHRIVRRNLPQKLYWYLQRSGDELRITADFRIYGWFAAWMSALWLLSIGCFAAAELAVRQGWHLASAWTAAAVPGLVVFSLGLLFWSATAFSALGGRRSDTYFQSFLDGFEDCGGHLEPDGLGISLRHGLSLVLFFLIALLLAVVFLWAGGIDELLPRMDVLSALLVLMALVCLLGLSAAFILVRKGFSYRSTAIVAGLGSTVSMLFFLAVPLFPLLGTMDTDSFRREVRVATALLQRDFEGEGWTKAAADQVVDTAQRRLTELRFFSTLQLGAQGMVLALSLFMLWTAVKASAAAHPVLGRMKKFQQQEVHLEAVSGVGQVRFFQIIFILAWTVMAAFLAAELALVMACAVQALMPSIPFPPQQPAQLTAAMFAFILGFSPESTVLEWLFRSAWVGFCFICLTALAASVGHLALKRYAAFRQLTCWRADGSRSRDRQFLELTQQLSAAMSAPSVEFALLDHPFPVARSMCFGWIRKRRFVEISTGFLRILTQIGLVKSVIAHELAHHVLRHPQKDNRWRWLGRLALAGDGFVRALQDSFGYEVAAAEKAADQGFTRENHAVAQRKSRSVAPFIDHPPAVSLPGNLAGLQWIMSALEGFQQAAPKSEDASKATGWKESWRLFRQQYFCGFELHYWSPEYGSGATESVRAQRPDEE